MNDGVLSAIGDTPLVRLTHALRDPKRRFFAKLEMLNPGGSLKDRSALSVIRQAINAGEIKQDTVVIESSSGNMGIGLAQVCSVYGLRFICVVDKRTTAQNIRLLKAYGVEVDLVTEPDPETGDLLQARINRVKELRQRLPNNFWPDQYSNIFNPLAQRQTMREIAQALEGNVDYVLCAASTCGTFRGCVEYIREMGLKTKVIPVDAVGSVIFGGKKGSRLIPGHGAGVRPALFRPDLADCHITVSDLDCVTGCLRLARNEALLVGGSSGGVFIAAERLQEKISPQATCVGIFADRGERYLDTIFSASWIQEHFGDISHLLRTPTERSVSDDDANSIYPPQPEILSGSGGRTGRSAKKIR
jgi:cysteine synthase A